VHCRIAEVTHPRQRIPSSYLFCCPMRFAHTLHSHGSLPPSLPLRVCSQLPLAEVDRLDGEGRIFRGKIRINPKNFEQGFIPGGKREVSPKTLHTHKRIRQLTLTPSQAKPCPAMSSLSVCTVPSLPQRAIHECLVLHVPKLLFSKLPAIHCLAHSAHAHTNLHLSHTCVPAQILTPSRITACMMTVDHVAQNSLSTFWSRTSSLATARSTAMK
jgi:hypothetical protein